jgi:hypothetical protein
MRHLKPLNKMDEVVKKEKRQMGKDPKGLDRGRRERF